MNWLAASHGFRGRDQRLGRAVMTFMLFLPALIFLGIWFVWPLGQLVVLSFQHEDGNFAAYHELLSSEVFRTVFINTLKLAVFVTIMCALLAYPAAWLLTRVRGFWFSVGLYCILVPFWISILVRTFSWMLLLERNGPVNSFPISLGAEVINYCITQEAQERLVPLGTYGPSLASAAATASDEQARFMVTHPDNAKHTIKFNDKEVARYWTEWEERWQKFLLG